MNEGARMVHHSMWESGNPDKLIRIATLIKNIGGRARIMEERLLFE